MMKSIRNIEKKIELLQAALLNPNQVAHGRRNKKKELHYHR